MTSLLSRFDFIFIMVDDMNPDNDLAQANFKLSHARWEEEEEEKKFWSIDRLTKYILLIQRYLDPVISDEASLIFRKYFQYMKQKQNISKDRKTTRMLESLIRISEAHARLMFRNEVTVFDAI